MSVDFGIGEDINELTEVVAEFFVRRDDARAIATASATGSAADGARWVALCDIGLPSLCIPEPRGIGASLLDAAAVAEKFGAVLLPEPASASIVLARTWAEHDGSPAVLDALLDGSSVADLASFSRVDLSADGTATGQLRLVTGDATDLVAVPARAALVLLERSALSHVGDRSDVDPSRPTVLCEFDGVAPVEVVELDEDAIVDMTRALAMLTVAELVGGMQAALDATIGYVGERRQFGRSIGSFQSIKHQLADMYVAVEQARAAVQFAAISVDSGAPSAATDVASATRWIPRAAIDVFDNAIHLHGAMGYSWEVDVHLHLRRALAVRALLNESIVVAA